MHKYIKKENLSKILIKIPKNEFSPLKIVTNLQNKFSDDAVRSLFWNLSCVKKITKKRRKC